MVSFTPLSPETLADQRLYLDASLQEVSCLDCLARVRVKKSSEFQTSIQWTAEAQANCAEFARKDAEAGRRLVHESCSRLKASIDTAVRDGRLRVSGGTDEVAYVDTRVAVNGAETEAGRG
ncbi:hypothetical protein [Nocardioides pakistanensis]